MTAAELRAWWIFYQMAPWGEERADLRMGISTSSMVNMWAAKGRGAGPGDFIPDFYKPHLAPKRHPAQSADQMMGVLLKGTRQAGGTVMPGAGPDGPPGKVRPTLVKE